MLFPLRRQQYELRDIILPTTNDANFLVLLIYDLTYL